MKKLPILLFLVAATLNSFAESKIASIEELISSLNSVQRYDASAQYIVLLPSSTDEIIYDVNLQSAASHNDTLSDCEYLISWSLPTPSGRTEGFSAYNNGSHYRYRNQRLLEYHFQWDSIPFKTSDGGVQRNAQFVELLPQSLAKKIKRITNSDDFEFSFEPEAIIEGRNMCRLVATEKVRGYTVCEAVYIFDPISVAPVRIRLLNNPGEISEQEVTVEFNQPTQEPIERFTEEQLIALYPDIFERFRTNNFRVESLVGTPLPTFSLPTLSGERYTHNQNDKLASGVIIAMLDPAVASTTSVIASLRKSVAELPYAIEIVWTFNSNSRDEIERLIEKELADETTIHNAQSLARDIGVNTYPTFIFVNSDDIISGVHIGANKNLSEIVIEKTALMQQINN